MGLPDYLVLTTTQVIMDTGYFLRMANQQGWSKELLYQLVDSVKDYAIFVSDSDGIIVSWNIGAEKIFGYAADEAIGQNCRMLFTEEDRADGIPEKEREIAKSEGCAEDERWHLRKDGSYFFASGVQTPLYDEAGRHTGFAKIARDLTERINFEEALQGAKEDFEVQVREKTSELKASNESLRLEIIERTQSERLRIALLRKIVKTQEDERKRIARDIHDHIGQGMTGLQLKLAMLKKECETDKLRALLDEIQSITSRIDAEIDFLAWELRPSVLDDLGLAAALKKFVQDWSHHFGIPAEFEEIGLNGKNLLPEIEINLYRIGQEALNNIAKHARANNVSTILEKMDGTVKLIIEDDGIGFDASGKSVITGEDRGMGLLGMNERAQLIGGKLEIESSTGNGTTIFVSVPALFDEEKR